MTKRRRRRRRRRRYEGAADQEGFPVFLSLSPREEKSRSKERRRTRSREEKKKEEEDEHLYKDLHGQWEWNAGTSLVPDFTPASSPPDQPSPSSFRPSLSSFFPSPSDTSSSSSTPLFGIHRRPRCCSPNHHRVLPLYPASPFTTTLLCVPVQLPLRAATALLYYYYYHHCFRLLLLPPPPLLLLQLLLRVHDLVTICGRSLHSIIDSN